MLNLVEQAAVDTLLRSTPGDASVPRALPFKDMLLLRAPCLLLKVGGGRPLSGIAS
jgi:hypothetical protein